MLLNNTYTHTHTPSNKPCGLAELCTGVPPRREPQLRVCAVGPEQRRLPVCLQTLNRVGLHRHQQPPHWAPRRGGWWGVVVKDGMKMRGSKGGLEGTSERLFPQNSGLIISPLWSVRFGFPPRSAAERLPVWLCVCVCVWLHVWTTQNTFIL